MQTAPDIIFSRQADGTRDYISSRFYEYTGAPAGSAIGFGWLEYVHPEDKEPSPGAVDALRAVRREVRIRIPAARRGLRSIAGSALAPCRFAMREGDILKWYGTCSDIHDSKMLEQSIRDSAIELEKIVDSRTAALRGFPAA